MIRTRTRVGRPGERGQALVLWVVMLTAILGLAGLVIDGSNLQENRRKLQNAADAAALAGAYDLPGNSSQATTDALAWLVKNGSGAGEVVTNQVNQNGDTITVSLSRKVNYVLAQVLGTNSSTVTATAQVKVATVTGYASTASDFFPYAVWAWTNKGAAHQVGDIVTFRSNAWVTDNVQNPGSGNQDWTAKANNFKGFLSVPGGQVSVGDDDSDGGNKCGQEPVAALQAAYAAKQPIVLPIIDFEQGNGNYTFTVAGFVALNINIAGSQIPNGCPNDFTGQIISFSTTQGQPTRTGTQPQTYGQCKTGTGICMPVLTQ